MLLRHLTAAAMDLYRLLLSNGLQLSRCGFSQNVLEPCPHSRDPAGPFPPQVHTSALIQSCASGSNTRRSVSARLSSQSNQVCSKHVTALMTC